MVYGDSLVVRSQINKD
jgi:hypothetical protein